MLDNKVKILPSHIQKGGGDDDESDMLVTFSFLLENYLYQNWKDADLLAFINLMRNPGTRVKDLVTHPLLLPPDQRELLYRTTWTLSFHQVTQHCKASCGFQMVPTE